MTTLSILTRVEKQFSFKYDIEKYRDYDEFRKPVWHLMNKMNGWAGVDEVPSFFDLFILNAYMPAI